MALGWTEEESEIAVELWQAGHSGSKIASDPRIRRSRSSVIAHIFRLRMKRDDLKPMSRTTTVRMAVAPRRTLRQGSNPPPRKRTDKRLTKPKIISFDKADWTAPPVVVVVPEDQRRQLLGPNGAAHGGLEDRQCRYINGDPTEPGWHFCHQQQEPGLPYCADHIRACFQPPELQPRRPIAAQIAREVERV